MTLHEWRDNGWINEFEPSREDIANLLSLAERELSDASVTELSPDARFYHAYAAVRVLCQVALHAAGFAVPKGGREHERVLDSLRFTLGSEWSQDADYFDHCRRMRHKSLYERSGVARESDVSELLEAAKRLYVALEAWLAKEHRSLLDDSS